MAYEIKQMGLGGILDQAIAVVRDNFVLLFTILIIVFIPISLIQGFFVATVMPVPPADATQDEVARMQLEFLQNYWPWLTISALISVFIVYPISNAAIVEGITRRYLGQSITAMDAIQFGIRRMPAFIGTGILWYLAVVGGMMLCFVPGIVFAIWFALWQQAVVCENLAGPEALGRSKRLVSGDWTTLLALGIILLVIGMMVGGGANFIPQMHLRVVISTLLQAFMMLISIAAHVAFYFSCRCRLENFDLHFLAQAMGVSPSETKPEIASKF